MSAAPLSGRVCLVTGASRGLGRGIALQLGEAGATVYITGRSLDSSAAASGVGGSLRETAAEVEQRGGKCIPVRCDHSKDADVDSLFERIRAEQSGRLDVLVNNAYSAVNRIMESTGRPFWEQDLDMWDAVNNVGLRNHYRCSALAARMMVDRGAGLIVNISSGGGLTYIFNVAYGVGKEAVDRMSVDMAIELRRHGVACVSLWPGATQTEEIVAAFRLGEAAPDGDRAFQSGRKMFVDGESPEFAGKAVVALASDPKVMQKSGKVHLAAELASEYGFTDIGGRQIVSMRSAKYLLDFYGHPWMAAMCPAWVKIPFWIVSTMGHKL